MVITNPVRTLENYVVLSTCVFTIDHARRVTLHTKNNNSSSNNKKINKYRPILFFFLLVLLFFYGMITGG